MEDNFKYPENHTKLNGIRFDEKHKQHVLNQIKMVPIDPNNIQKPQKNRRFTYSTIAVAVIFTLLIGGSYFSTTLAKVMARVPYFSLFIQQEEYKYALYDVIEDVMIDKKYKLNSLDASVQDRVLSLSIIGSIEEVNSIKKAVKKDVNAALIANNFGRYTINVNRVDVSDMVADSPEVQKYIEDSQQLEKEIKAKLDQNDYELAFPMEVRINKTERFIYVAVPRTEKRIDDLKELLRTTSKKYGEFKLRVTRIDMKAREQEKRWDKNNILSILVGGLMENNRYHVTGFSYSFHPLPLQIKVKTSLNGSDAADKEIAKEIQEEMHFFIKNHEITKDVRHDPYEIKIYGKDKKQIN
jgi:hypothetical protein